MSKSFQTLEVFNTGLTLEDHNLLVFQWVHRKQARTQRQNIREKRGKMPFNVWDFAIIYEIHMLKTDHLKQICILTNNYNKKYIIICQCISMGVQH